MLRRLLALLALVSAAAAAAGVLSATPVRAATRVVEITQDGPRPARLQLAPGDRVRFTNRDSFPHGVQSASRNWTFRSGSLAPGESFDVPDPLRAAGTYAYRDDDLLDDFAGDVVVRAAARTAPRPVATRSPGAGSPSPATSAGSSPQALPSDIPPGDAPTPGPPGQDPAVAPTAPAVAPPPAATRPASPPGATPGVVALPGGPLPQTPTPRGLGLPIALAVVAATGTSSLLVRVLLAHPAARAVRRTSLT